jgi:hypothetical protein
MRSRQSAGAARVESDAMSALEFQRVRCPEGSLPALGRERSIASDLYRFSTRRATIVHASLFPRRFPLAQIYAGKVSR